MKTVGDVLQGMRVRGFSEERWCALHAGWDAVSRPGLLGGPVQSVDPWTHWIPPDLQVLLMDNGRLRHSEQFSQKGGGE